MHRVLVVEDEANIRNNLREMLELSGHSVMAVENAQDALDLLEGEVPDLILSDILMPGMNGFELLRAIQHKENLRNIPFLFLSAKIELDDIRHGMNLGADDYLTKPVKLKELTQAIDVRIARKKALTESSRLHLDNAALASVAEKRKELKEKLDKVTSSEYRVLRRLALNQSSQQIGDELYLSFKTIQNHRANMVKKLGFCGQNALLSFAVSCNVAGLFNEV